MEKTKRPKPKQIAISFAKFTDAIQVLQRAATGMNLGAFQQALFPERDINEDGGDDFEFVMGEYQDFTKNPLAYYTRMDLAYQGALFEAAKKSINEALAKC